MTVVLAILNALAAIPSILGYVETFVQGIIMWWIERQTNETLSAISDACSLTVNAKDDASRFAAAAAWQAALQKSRVTQ